MYNRPLYPGAMTPAQLTRRTLRRIRDGIAAAIITAATMTAIITIYINAVATA